MKISEYLAKNGDGYIDPEAVSKGRVTPFTPETGAGYYCFSLSHGDVLEFRNNGDKIDTHNAHVGNMFRTEEEAAAHGAYVDMVERLRFLAAKHGGVDWNYARKDSGVPLKWCILCEASTGEVKPDCWRTHATVGAVYFPTREAVQAAIDEIGADNIREILFGLPRDMEG